MSSGATVEGDERLRLFLALQLPEPVSDALHSWAKEALTGGRRVDTFHITIAFLGSQRGADLAAITGVLRDAAAQACPFELEPVHYRETRSVGMLVLADPSGDATRLAERVHAGLRGLGVYEPERRKWLPHVTVLRFRTPPRLDPPLPPIGPFTPSGAAAFLSRLHPSGARYEVLESCSLGI